MSNNNNMKNMDANVGTGTTQDNTEPTPTFDNRQDEILYKKKLIKEAIDSGDWVTAATLMADIKSLELEVEAEQHNNNKNSRNTNNDIDEINTSFTKMSPSKPSPAPPPTLASNRPHSNLDRF